MHDQQKTTIYFGRFTFPNRLDNEWIAKNVPAMKDPEWTAFMYVLGRRHWTEDELNRRIFRYRPFP